MMMDVDPLIDGIMKALARGKHEITVPWKPAAGYIVRAIAPRFMRRNLKRATLDALARSKSSTSGET